MLHRPCLRELIVDVTGRADVPQSVLANSVPPADVTEVATALTRLRHPGRCPDYRLYVSGRDKWERVSGVAEPVRREMYR
jgi:hypothetical protein